MEPPCVATSGHVAVAIAAAHRFMVPIIVRRMEGVIAPMGTADSRLSLFFSRYSLVFIVFAEVIDTGTDDHLLVPLVLLVAPLVE
jgi:hypothetical protein